jgi:hypothetical protein
MRRRVHARIVRVAGVLAGAALVASCATADAVASLSPDGGRPFAADSPWNTPIPASARVDPRSDAMVAQLTDGAPAATIYEYGDAIWDADASTPRQRIVCERSDEWGACGIEGAQVPIPDGAEPDPGSDGAMIVVDHERGLAWDFWRARRDADGRWRTDWGGVVDLASDGVVPLRRSSRGSGIARLGGIVRTWEIAQGRIPHALAVATRATCRDEFRAPATKSDGTTDGDGCVPPGARIQLDPAVDLDQLDMPPGERAVAEALQTYGAFVVDSGGSPLSIAFQNPVGRDDPYPGAGLVQYDPMTSVPWQRLRVLATADGR